MDEKLLLLELNARLKQLLSIEMQILSALTKKDFDEIAKEAGVTWAQYFKDKFPNMDVPKA